MSAKDVGGHAVAILEASGVELGPGLTDTEFDEIAAHYGVEFNPDHRSLLATALPLGDRWPNWRDGDDTRLRLLFDQAVNGLIFDALRQDPPFWGASWGRRPTAEADIATVVRREFAKWPRLIPIYAHRMTPAAPSPSGSPVFSVWQTDVIYYGAHLLEYLDNEMSSGDRRHLSPRTVRVPYWTDFVESGNNPDVI